MSEINTPLFSVCICTFNDMDSMEEFFPSILRQIDERYEVVVTDGGSTDGTLEYIREKQAETTAEIRIFSQEDGGLGTARQICVDNARGDYLLEQVDADMVYADCFDEILECYLEKIEKEGPFQLQLHGMRITPRKLHDELGGWRPFPNGFQENELARRFFKYDKLRLMDVRVAVHLDTEFGFRTAVRRYLYNHREKLRCGISPWYALWHLYTSNLPLWRKMMDTGTIIITYLWGITKEHYDTFDVHDPLAYEIDKRLYEGCEKGTYKDIRLTPPPEVKEVCYEQQPDKVYSYTDASL